MKQKISIINYILFALVLIGDGFYIATDSLAVKSITSALFVLIGIINFAYFIKTKQENKNFALLLLIGLVFGMLGDIILEIQFIIGALLFAIGHVFYFFAFCAIEKFNLKNLIASACLFVPCTLFLVLAPIFDFGGIFMEIVCIAYALIISCMTGKAVSNAIKSKTPLNILLAIASILFTFSDLMLVLNVFGPSGLVFSILCLGTYYPAQILLAYSILFSTNKKNWFISTLLHKKTSQFDLFFI